MADALSIAAVVEMDLVDLNGAGPWPSGPEGVDVYECVSSSKLAPVVVANFGPTEAG